MEGLNPLLHLLIQVRLGLERGDALKTVLKEYLNRYQTEMTPALQEWVSHLEQGRSSSTELRFWNTSHRQALLMTFHRGIRGESILPALIALEQDVFAACEEELERRAALLPLQCLVPLLLFQFPALMILILGPILSQLMASLS